MNYEYEVNEYTIRYASDFSRQLNGKAKFGWKVISVYALPSSTEDFKEYTVVWERPKA